MKCKEDIIQKSSDYLFRYMLQKGYKKVIIPEVSHEETVTEEIWNGHKDDVAAFTFNEGISVNVIKAVDLDLNGNDQVYTSGTETHDIIYGTESANVIEGKGGDDIILSGDGDDVIVGGDGDDVILGGDGDDTLVGDDAEFDAEV